MDHSGKDVHQIFAFVEQRIGINIRITAKLEKSVLGLNQAVSVKYDDSIFLFIYLRIKRSERVF